MATPPMMGQGDIMDWPPVMEVAASLAQSLKPSIMREVVTSRSFSVIPRQTPRTMRTVSMLVTPMAKTSLRTLQQAILP